MTGKEMLNRVIHEMYPEKTNGIVNPDCQIFIKYDTDNRVLTFTNEELCKYAILKIKKDAPGFIFKYIWWDCRYQNDFDEDSYTISINDFIAKCVN